MKKRRAVGGLISLIGIIIIFSIASLAFLELNSIQTGLTITSNKISKMILERNTESLNFTMITPNPGVSYTFDGDNIGNQASIINSYLLLSTDGKINGQGYLNEKTKVGKSFTFDVNEVPNALSDNSIVFVTDSGKTCTIPLGVTFRIC